LFILQYRLPIYFYTLSLHDALPILMINFQLVDTYVGVLLPMVVAPIAVFFFRQYAIGLPAELMDAARIDGATEYGIYFKVMLPRSEEHTSELQSRFDLVCRLLLEKK